ncbi:MAG TPA: DUF488 family protein [Arthrobacter sp.]|jgi:uncharacterized protein YeaO (DUF488 family)|uniref:DUF488 domain-containing protein n=1 Tax=Arthrobacter sp. TaxID=1667 RepID=UPI002F42013D
MTTRHEVKVRRIYEEPLETDGMRILVDRLWPRGLSKEKAHIDEWCKAIAPSAELRKWYGHAPALFEDFSRRYRRELQEPDPAATLARLRQLAHQGPLTLLTATKEPAISEAAVLCAMIQESLPRPVAGHEPSK